AEINQAVKAIPFSLFDSHLGKYSLCKTTAVSASNHLSLILAINFYNNETFPHAARHLVT
ncbi:MAG: hypothetical protein ACK2UP_07590, partial [Candidatus Promineifilaceae bacterium]